MCYILDMYQEIPYFNCDCCGRCCHGAIQWTREDFARFRGTGLLNGLKFFRHHSANPARPWVYYETKYKKELQEKGAEKLKDKCPFLGDDNKCTVYGLRMNICRKYSNVYDPDAVKYKFGCREFKTACYKLQEKLRYLADPELERFMNPTDERFPYVNLNQIYRTLVTKDTLSPTESALLSKLQTIHNINDIKQMIQNLYQIQYL